MSTVGQISEATVMQYIEEQKSHRMVKNIRKPKTIS